MKKLFLIILAVVVMACNDPKPLKKPFVIIGKESHYNALAEYQFSDINGNGHYFTDSISKYSIGDTIK